MFVDRTRKAVMGLVIVALLIATGVVAWGGMSHITTGHAQTSTVVSSTDFYTPKSWAPWGTTFDGSGRVWVALPGCDPSPYCGSNTPPGVIAVFNPAYNAWPNVYQLPAGFGQALFMAIDKQGRVWFPMPMTNSIGMLDPSDNSFSQWAVPTPGAGPWGIAIDSKGTIWFTEHYSNKIGSFNPVTHTFNEIATPATDSQPYGITVDASDNIWFTENKDTVALIGEYTSNGVLKEYKIRTTSTKGLTPHLITLDPAGNIWWTEGWVGALGKLDITNAQPGTTNGVTEYAYQAQCSNCGKHTSGISIGKDGTVWFDDSLQSIFGSFGVDGQSPFTLYNTPTSNSHPHDGLNLDSQNRLWFDEEFANKLAKITLSGSVASTPTPTVALSPTATIPAVTPTVTSTPTPTGTVLAQDTFQRADQVFWGTASDGQTWSADASSKSVFSISGNTGQVANAGTSYSAILGTTATNAEVVFSGSMSSYANSNIGSVLRFQDTNNWYKAYIDGQSLIVQKKVGGTTTVIGQTAFAATANTSYSLRFRIVGSTLYAKVWATSSAEPSSWQITVNDTALTSGACGLRILAQNGATATFTMFKAQTV